MPTMKKINKHKQPSPNQELVQFSNFVQQKMQRFEQAFLFLQKRIKILQMNLVVLNNALEEKGILMEDEFIKKFSIAENEMLIPQNLKGKVVVSIYS